MLWAGGPAWDYTYPMYLGAGQYGPGGIVPTVTPGGSFVGTTTGTGTGTGTGTTDTTTTTTPTHEAEPKESWERYIDPRTGDPVFPSSPLGVMAYNDYVESLTPNEAFGLLEGLNRTRKDRFPGMLGSRIPAIVDDAFPQGAYGGAGDPTWDASSVIDPNRAWYESGRSPLSEVIAAEVDALTPEQQQMEVIIGPVSAAQRKQDQLAAQAQQASIQRQLDAAAQATAQAQQADAQQRALQQAAAQNILAEVTSRDNHGYSQQEVTAAVEIARGGDTFGGLFESEPDRGGADVGSGQPEHGGWAGSRY